VPILTAARHALADRLDRPTREKIAPRAADYGARGGNPVESGREL
jgi:hypothetical protein